MVIKESELVQMIERYGHLLRSHIKARRFRRQAMGEAQ